MAHARRRRFPGGIIGRGGTGVVYRARQAGLGREVALKVLAAGPYADAVDVANFRAEAAMAAALQHPGIVTVFEVGEADGHPYFSMELVEGTPLAKLTAAGPLEPQRAARYAQAVAQAVGAAHARGILHRDLKPGNVLIDRTDQPRVTDFGLARQLGCESTQHIAGSPGYMPPEQADPQLGGIGVASDVYGLGAQISKDGRLLATCEGNAVAWETHGAAGPVWLRDLASGRELATLRGHLTEVSAVAMAPDGRTLVSIEPQQGLRFWDLATLREVAVISLPAAGSWLDFAPDGHTLAVGLGDGRVRLLKAP